MARFLQINLGRGREAQDLLSQVAAEKKVDVLIISEQYRKPEIGAWYQDTTGKAAIAVPNNNIKIGEVSKPTADFVWAEVENVRGYSCYFSPNRDYEDFMTQLDNLEESLRTATGGILVAGDFNSKSPEWGSRVLDNRGEALSDLVARMNLVVLNEGNAFTFRRGATGSVVDVTFATEGVAARTEGWQVLEDATLSDHQYLEYCVNASPRGQQGNLVDQTLEAGGWVLQRLNRLLFKEALEIAKVESNLQVLTEAGDPDAIVNFAIGVMTNACDRAMPRRKIRARTRKSVYWWSHEIGELRQECMAARRAAQRRRRRDESGQAYEALQSQFREARKKLKQAIRRNKRNSWEELCRTIEEDPWGLPYRLVTKKLVGRQPIPGLLDPERMRGIVNTLFPFQERRPVRPRHGEEPRIELMTIEELQEAKGRLKYGKAPGPDNIPNEVVREVIEAWPELLLATYNVCLRNGVFHRRWKMQKLVLLRKGDKPLGEPSSYRPICLLDNLGKLFERLLLQRLEKHVESNGGLSERQYGFRKGRSTVDAIAKVIETAETVKQGTWKTKGFCALVTLDVKNAFNTARWDRIMDALTSRRTPEYLKRMIDSYLDDRILTYETESGTVEHKVTAGVPQGSVLGPFLWNLMYDGMLNLELPRGATIVGFADDVAVVVTARTTGTLEISANESLRRTSKWLSENGLQLAVHKTEAVLVTDKRLFAPPNLALAGERIPWKRDARYLGVQVDSGLRYVEHVIRATEKAATTAAALARLMPNVRGPREGKRRLLNSVVHAKVLYGAEIWAKAVDKVAAKRRLAAVQRRSALRVISAYRTVSEEAALVLASTPPIDLLIKEKQEVYEDLREYRNRHEREQEKANVRNRARQRLMARWQDRWENTVKGRWTYRLIPNIETWYSRTHGQMSYHLTQALTGHGCFNAYLEKFNKTDTTNCLHCGHSPDDAGHTIFRCPAQQEERTNLRVRLGGIRLQESNLIEIMLANEQSWGAVQTFITATMKKKEEAERAEKERRLV